MAFVNYSDDDETNNITPSTARPARVIGNNKITTFIELLDIFQFRNCFAQSLSNQHTIYQIRKYCISHLLEKEPITY